MPAEILREQLVLPVAGSNSMGVYLAHPATPGQYPAVIVGMELFGVTRHIRDVADRLAGNGYLVMAPDFYHRLEPDAELSYDQAGRSKGFELLHRVRRRDVLQDVQASMRNLEARADFRGRIGFLGFSVGGHIGYLAATRLPIAACAIFYAGWLNSTEIELGQPEPTLTLTAGIAKNGGRIAYFVGGKDFLIDAAQRQAIESALSEAGVRHEMVVYAEAGHGFFCDERDTFNQPSRDDAWQRVLELFAAELRI